MTERWQEEVQSETDGLDTRMPTVERRGKAESACHGNERHLQAPSFHLRYSAASHATALLKKRTRECGRLTSSS